MVTCPLCCQPGFNTSDALCSALISASTRKLFCPVCNEMLIGLDKLTIHLFGHTSIKNLTDSSNLSNSACQSKILAAQNSREDVANIVAPVLYIQADNGQLFALAPSSLVNQFGSVTINTQNYISNTSVLENNLAGSQNPSGDKHSEKPREFSSCKDLLTSGYFSEPFDVPADAIEPSSCTQIGNLPSMETELNCTPVTHEKPQIDKSVIETSSQTLTNSQPLAVGKDLGETESSKPLVPCDICEMGFSNKAILAVHKQLMHKNLVSEEFEIGAHKSSEKSRKKPLNCSWCPATFNLKSSLMIHVKVTHPGNFTYILDY